MVWRWRIDLDLWKQNYNVLNMKNHRRIVYNGPQRLQTIGLDNTEPIREGSAYLTVVFIFPNQWNYYHVDENNSTKAWEYTKWIIVLGFLVKIINNRRPTEYNIFRPIAIREILDYPRLPFWKCSSNQF